MGLVAVSALYGLIPVSLGSRSLSVFGQPTILLILVHPLWIVGAIRLAKPDSWWARRNYEGDEPAQAREGRAGQAGAPLGGREPFGWRAPHRGGV